ncbi:MAG: hypothetical protein A3H50_02790 [Candidatus Levybacteria bacterium RIFCSPLOWO2_02_FULL_37_10]|nr:MAG: hypothetical protein A2860_01715 [Candidatus Levybacteria bacterium RIFCSPHIGHO2_01_FULL_37_33]OGH15770.1 MAG: hypothetical protein A3C97_01185 [Candidatus Levybacteria bacterium RIFCSPHIGHO2_02_FULL_37_11]OGH29652.1 MAG: hypothetical protein A3F30_02795 [Candidatus Levybacteria bacterium RIFCSPHIGHO2_12_FULL_37_12]OGH32579.1 MAG: hypothetical protein A2953_02310 [Candidatus Levybacteria bacterium RIFCSPLOWO2_01_FULL_36_54]OGH43195.1 MAG: hypothetical protein A3H50_02790 [Candidatus Lev
MDEIGKSFDITQDKFYNKALKFLSYRPRSEKEIRDKLRRVKNKKNATTEVQKEQETQNFSVSKNLSDSEVAREALIDQVISKLKKNNYINDEEFIKWWIEQRTTFKPRSLKLIKIELRQKGIDAELIDSVIQNSEFRIQNDLELAKKLIEKRLPRYKNLPREEKFQKIARFLSSKGFSYDIIKEIFKELK